MTKFQIPKGRDFVASAGWQPALRKPTGAVIGLVEAVGWQVAVRKPSGAVRMGLGWGFSA